MNETNSFVRELTEVLKHPLSFLRVFFDPPYLLPVKEGKKAEKKTRKYKKTIALTIVTVVCMLVLTYVFFMYIFPSGNKIVMWFDAFIVSAGLVYAIWSVRDAYVQESRT